jgi:hypothetical protein
MSTAISTCSNDLAAWALRVLADRRNFSRIEYLRGKFHPHARMRERFSLTSRFDAAFVSGTPESVT